MRQRHAKSFLSNPQATPAGFFVWMLRRLFKDFKKVVAAVLVFTFSYSQILLAADPRELLLQAKAAFDNPDQRRTGGGESTPQALAMAQSNAQTLVDNQNALANLGNMNFSLTTQNGDILKYVDNKLSEVQTKDGAILSNITVNNQGLIQNADLKLSDGSIQVYQDGKVIGYMTPDGTTIEYDVNTGRVLKTTTKTGVVSNYTYQFQTVEEDAGCDRKKTVQKLVSTTIRSDKFTAIYNANGHLQSLQYKDGSAYSFNDGVLQWVLIPNVGYFTYKAKKEGGNTRITLNDTYNSRMGSRFGCDPEDSGPKPVYYTTTSRAGCDGDEHTTRHLMPNTIPDTNPESILYDKNRNPQEVVLLNGTHFYFTNGVLRETKDKYGRVIADFNFAQSGLGNITGTTITQNNLNSTYDAEGNLASIKLNDLTIYYKNSKIDSITKADGTEFEDLSFDAQGNLKNATIITPNGEVRTYVDGALKSIEHQDTKIFYDLGKPLQLIQKDLVYDFDYTAPEKIEAHLSTAAPDALTAVTMEYDENFNLKKVIRQNNEILSYLDNDLKEYQVPNEADRVFDYVKDANGEVLSYTVTQGDTVTYYDKNHQVLKSIISPTAQNPHTLEVDYSYGKIRKILKDSVLTFNYDYVFDTDGSEKTVIHDLEENTTKTYKAEKLLTAMAEDTSVLSTYSYNGDKVSQVDVTRLGRTLHTYIYSYSGDNTIVRDEENVIRTYDAANKLTFLEKEGQKWAYSYKKNSSQDLTTISDALNSVSNPAAPSASDTPSADEEIVQERLIQKTLSDGSLVSYDDKGQVSRIDLPDGTFITDVVLNEDRSFQKASVHLADGTVKIFNNSTIQEEISADGTHFYFSNNSIKKVCNVDGKTLEYSYAFDFAGNVNFIWVKKDDVNLKYNSLGNLIGITVPNNTSFYNLKEDLSPLGEISGYHLEADNIQLPLLKSDKFYIDASYMLKQENNEIAIPLTNIFQKPNYFGDGQDGDQRITANTTLVREMHYNSLIVDPGVILNPNGFKIYVKETLINNGTISANGNNGGDGTTTNGWSGAQQGAGGTGFSDFQLGGSGAGGDGADGYPAYPGASILNSMGGNGGNGGAANGGSLFLVGGTALTKPVNFLPDDISQNQQIVRGGAGGGGGAKGNYASGGGGGAGGGAIAIFAKEIQNQNGIISANGGKGGNGGESGYSTIPNGGKGASGGGGGGGGFIYLVYSRLIDGSISVIGGKGGAEGKGLWGVNNGLPGANGSDGNIFKFIPKILNFSLDFDLLNLPYKNHLYLDSFAYHSDWFNASTSSILDSQTIISQEYSSSGKLETQIKADKTVTLFNESNKPVRVLDEQGTILIEYSYDSDGNPSKVYLKNARDTLPDEINKAELSIEEQKANSLQALAQQKNLAYQSIESQVAVQNQALQSQLDSLQNQYNDVSGIKVSGKKAKNQKGDALNQIGGAMDQVRAALAQLYEQESAEYAKLDAQVKALSDQIEADAQDSLTALHEQEAALKKEILRQEISPIVYDYYRRILGRDPSSREYDNWINKVDYNSVGDSTKTTTGEDFNTALNNYISGSSELAERTAYVNSIKQSVRTKIQGYLSLSNQDRLVFAQAFGLAQSDLIALSQVDADKILTWLDTRSLHFGQSAFISLETLLDQKGISYDREDLAQKCILIDILTGVISPLDDGDLVISVFALNKVASLYGVNLSGANLNWDDLRKIYDTTCGSSVTFDGSGDYLSLADNPDYDLSNGVWTIDFWINPDLSYADDQEVLSQESDSLNRMILRVRRNGSVRFYADAGGSNAIDIDTDGGVLSSGTWSHVEIVENNEQFFIYVNGVQKNTRSSSGRVANMTGALFVGKSIPSIPGSFFKGSLQDLRISKGIARHTQNFTPSAERPFADTYTKLLLYADSQNGINDRSAANHVFTAYGNTTINGSKYVQPRIIAHINGNHFVIITGMTNDSITYIDPGIGADHQNESVTVTKEGFLKVWQGNVTLENQKLVTSSLQNKTLTATQTQNIRGAFWGSLLNLIGSVLNIFIPGLGTPFQLAALVVSLAEKDWISAIASTFAIVTGPAGTITDAFKNVFHGISQALGNLSTVFSSVGGAISSVYSSVTGFATNLAHGLGSFLHGALGVSSKIGAQIAQTAVSIGVNYGVSKGLETIGVNPQIAGFLGSLTAGAIIGGMKGNTVSAANQVVTQTQNIQSSLQQVITLNQVGRLGMELGLDSGFSNIIGLSMAAIQGIQIQNPNNFQFGQAFSQIRPNLFTSLAQYGVEKLGSAFGLDTRISSLIGAPISGLVDGLQNPGANIIDSINRGILRGGIQLGLEFATQDLDPFIGALSSRAITGAIAGGLSQDHNIFEGIFDAYINSTGNLLALDGIGTDAYQQALYLSKVIDFTDLINQKGLANALESYATSIFYRDSIEDIIKISGTIANYFQTALTNPQSLPENMRPTATTYNGQPAFLVPSGDGDYLIVSADGKKVLAQSKGANYYEGQFGVDQSGSWVLIKGTMTQYAETGIITLNINNGALAQAEFQDYEGDTAYQISGYSQADIKFDSTGALKDAVIVNEISGSEIRIKNGQYLNQSVSNNLQDALKENQPWYEQFNVSKVADFTDQKLDEIANWMLGNAQNNMGWVLTATALNSAKDIIKGAVTDALRFGSSLPGALDDFSNAWEQAKSGNMMSAGYQALLGSGKIFQEIGRATVIVGVVKGLAVSAVESEAKVALASSISEVGLSQGVIDSFKGGNYRTITLQSDVTVYRFVGDLSKIEGSGEGVYLTTKRYIGESTEDLINGLALPPGNDAKYMAEVKIPAGTKIQIGRAAPQPAFANNPEGGFTQLFIDNLEKSKLKFGKIVSKS